jgi:hypothetical protein
VFYESGSKAACAEGRDNESVKLLCVIALNIFADDVFIFGMY